MNKLKRFMEVTGITEEEALSALVTAIAPPQINAMRQNWRGNSHFGNCAPDTDVLRKLFVDADYRCTKCGSQLRIGLDHIDSNGKNHSVDNLQVLCFSCNRAKGLGVSKNINHGSRLAQAVIELYDETGEFPSNQAIKDRADITELRRKDLVDYLKKRLESNPVEYEYSTGL